jgi:hypothetical protein
MKIVFLILSLVPSGGARCAVVKPVRVMLLLALIGMRGVGIVTVTIVRV